MQKPPLPVVGEGRGEGASACDWGRPSRIHSPQVIGKSDRHDNRRHSTRKTTRMHAIDAIRAALSFGDMGLRYIEDMRDAPLTRMSSQGNHPLWVLGHLAVVEGRLRQVILGDAHPLERWKPLFDWGSEP